MTDQVNLTVFEDKAIKLIDKYQIPGVAIGLAQNGVPFYQKGFGFRNVENELPVNMDTVFGIASVTKSFTCVAILQLQEEGKLSTQDPVLEFLPEFSLPSNAANKMTLHHFMTHSTGIPPLPSIQLANKKSIDSDPAAKEFSNVKLTKENQNSIETYNQLMEYISQLDIKLLGSPGIEFSYSNDCFALLGAIIERVSGISYEDYVKEKILKPAGMSNSCFLISDLLKFENVTSLYSIRRTEFGNEIFESPIWWDAPAMRAAGYLKSTVNDMLKYGEIFSNHGKVAGNHILSPKSVQQMTQPYIKVSPGKYYGYGLFISPNYSGGTLIEHGGNHKSIASHFCAVPERGITGIVLTNLAGVPAPTILNGLINVFEHREFEYSPVSNGKIKYYLRDLNEFVGFYTSSAGRSLKMNIIDDVIMFENIPVEYIGKDSFLVSIRDQFEVITFIRNDEGIIDRLSFHYRQYSKEQAN